MPDVIEIVPGVSAVTDPGSAGAWHVLDHGALEVIQVWGDDRMAVNAARISKGRHWTRATAVAEAARPPGLSAADTELIDYLVRNRHTSPFEHAGATFRVKCPIFVARQWHRHRTQAYNEISGRYTTLPTENYVPDAARITPQDSVNKQGSAAGPVADTANVRDQILLAHETAGLAYQDMIADRVEDHSGLTCPPVANEIARVVLPVAQYTEFYATASLLNWMRFLGLRDDPHAQPEIRIYAAVISTELVTAFPVIHAAFKRHWFDAQPMSAGAAAVIRGLVAALAVDGTADPEVILSGLAGQKDKIGRRDVEDVRRLLARRP